MLTSYEQRHCECVRKEQKWGSTVCEMGFAVGINTLYGQNWIYSWKYFVMCSIFNIEEPLSLHKVSHCHFSADGDIATM